MEALRILGGALFTVAVCLAAGRMILREAYKDTGACFVVGASGLSLAVFVLCAVHLAYPLVLFALGLALLVRPTRLPRPPRVSPWMLPFAAYFVIYLCHAMAPEVSADGSGYHLGLVTRYLREHGFVPLTDNMYSAMPGGLEMLFLFAFPIGGHSAAALVHLAFLVALVWQVYRWQPVAGYAAALLLMASPAIGIAAASADNDVALAAVAFTLFRLIEQYREQGGMRLAAVVGLLAGFAFAIKYTAALAILYAVAMVAWRCRRAAVVTAACTVLIGGPWLIKNVWYWQNPLAPFFNKYFHNPYVMVSFEETYKHVMATAGGTSRWALPWEAAVRGGLTGVLGPVFLLAPLGLLALRKRAGWQLWAAAFVFGAGYLGNTGTRFLIPAIPFVALAMAVAMPRAAVALALIHALISWPAMMPRYARSDSWRVLGFPWREALRVRNVDHYMETHLPGYGIDRLIEARTRPGSTVFTFTPIPEAYTSRHIRIEYQAAANKIAGAMIWTAVESSYLPTWRVRFAFPRQGVSGVRLVQTGTGPALWTIHELRIFDGERELSREAGWRLTAHPYPWGIADAFDNSLATFWMCGEFLRPGQSVEATFGGIRDADSVLMESSPNQTGIALRLEGRDRAGKWTVLSGAPAISDAPRPLGLRRAVAEELKRRGVDYVLFFQGQVGADDFRRDPDLWNAAAVGEYGGARLYELR